MQLLSYILYLIHYKDPSSNIFSSDAACIILYHSHKDPSSNIVSHDADHDAAHISYL